MSSPTTMITSTLLTTATSTMHSLSASTSTTPLLPNPRITTTSTTTSSSWYSRPGVFVPLTIIGLAILFVLIDYTVYKLKAHGYIKTRRRTPGAERLSRGRDRRRQAIELDRIGENQRRAMELRGITVAEQMDRDRAVREREVRRERMARARGIYARFLGRMAAWDEEMQRERDVQAQGERERYLERIRPYGGYADVSGRYVTGCGGVRGEQRGMDRPPRYELVDMERGGRVEGNDGVVADAVMAPPPVYGCGNGYGAASRGYEGRRYFGEF